MIYSTKYAPVFVCYIAIRPPLSLCTVINPILLICVFVLRLLWLYCHSWWLNMVILPIFFRVTSLALGQSYDCPSASEVTLKYMGKITLYQTTTNRNKLQIMCLNLGTVTPGQSFSIINLLKNITSELTCAWKHKGKITLISYHIK